MKLSRRSVCLLVPALLLVAACGTVDDDGPVGEPMPSGDSNDASNDDGVDDPTEDSADEATVDGAWVLRRGHLDGEEIVLVDGWDVTMNIDGDQIGGTAACNGYGGTVDVGDEFELGGSFVVGEISWTEMGCEPEVMDLEQRFLAALAEIDSFELADTLALARTGVGTGLLFDRVEPVEDREVVGVTWRLDTLISGDSASNSAVMDAAFIEFNDDGTLVGSTGCRRLEGTWMLQGATIQIPSLSAIDDPAAGICSPESETLDGDLIAVVESGATVEVVGNRLTLTAPGGDGLSFFAEDSDTDTETDSEPDADSAPPDSTATTPSGSADAGDTVGLDPGGGVDGQVAYGSHRTEDGGEEALIEGTLAFDDDGCVRVGDVVLLWPFGTRWQAEPPAVIAGDLVLVAGDRIAAGGGFHDLGDVGWWSENDEAIEFLRGCQPPSGDGVFVIQHPVEMLG